MPLYLLILLVIFQVLVWFIYNRFLKEREISTRGQTLIGIFFTLSAAVIYYFYKVYLPGPNFYLFGAIALMLTFCLILKNGNWKFRFLFNFSSKKTAYLTATVFNILFQQAYINAQIYYFRSILPEPAVIIVFALFFGLLHSPLLFMKHVADREMDVVVSFFLGLICIFLIINFNLGYIYAYFVHFFLYVVYSMKIKDEALI